MCRPADIHAWVERKRMATVTSSCLQRQEVSGISLFSFIIIIILFFLSRGLLSKHNHHVHTDWTVQQMKHNVLISPQCQSKWNQHGRLEAQAAEHEHIGFRNAVNCDVYPTGERMLTHPFFFFFFKSQLQENREDGAQRYCTMFPETLQLEWTEILCS